MKYTNTLRQDLNSPLIKCQRNWLRRTAIIGILPIVFIVMLFITLIEWAPIKHTIIFVKDCWKGER